MENLQIDTNPAVHEVFDAYPKDIGTKISHLRSLIIDAATANDAIDHIEETLKWGEPSYIAKKGSTIRIDWKPKKPDQYAIYFKCTSLLVSSFRMVYPDLFQYEGKRAIVFQMDDKIPEKELKKCITAALTYHKVKHIPMLGL